MIVNDGKGNRGALEAATMMVALSLGMSTVAEGIETVGQFGALKQLRCGKGQGYLLSKALTATAAFEWLRRNITMT